MLFYLTGYIGAGTDDDPFRPDGSDDVAEWSSIDLSPPSGNKGLCLLAVPTNLPVKIGRDKIAEAGTERMPAVVKLLIENRLGVSGLPERFDQFVSSLLLLEGREDGSRWRPLKPEIDGALRIHLGGLLWEQFPIRGGATITESFNKADTDILGPDLTWTELIGDIDVVANAAQFQTLGGSSNARADSALASADHYAQFDVIAISGSSASTMVAPGTVVRKDNTATLTYYLGRTTQREAGASGYELFKFVAGSATSLGSLLNVLLPVTPFNLKTEANGSAIRVLQAGIEKVSVADTAITGNLFTGIRAFQGASSLKGSIDNFEAADLGVPPAAVLLTRSLTGVGA